MVHGLKFWRTEGPRKKYPNWSAIISYGMQMEKLCSTELLLGANHGCITTNLNQSVLHCNGNIPVHLQQKKVLKIAHTPSAGRVMLAMFWDGQGVLLPHSQKHVENVNSASYCEVLLLLQGAIHKKRPWKLSRGILLHHDNARHHTARATRERIQELQWELLKHPPYSPAWTLVTSSVTLTTTSVANISLMTKRLKQRCGSGQDNSQKDFCTAGFDALVKQWDK
jgi:hypothetical protein